MNEIELTSVLEEIITRWEIPGMAVAVVDAEKTLYTRCFGVQSLETGAPVSDHSIFCLASMSKSFVATAVMQLVERGQVGLDDFIVRYLPYFRLEGENSNQITIRQLLSHTSGLPDMDEDEYLKLVSHAEWDEGAAERYVRALGALKMAASPGERFLYSNIGYNVLGDLIAKVSGMPFESFLKTRVLLPAGMPSSTFLPVEIGLERLAIPHIRVPAMTVSLFYPYHRADAPASFLHATLGDMCRWLMTWLNRDRSASQALISPASLELMWTPAARWGYPPLYEDMGLGWTLGHYRGTKTVAHGGMGFGWTDFMVVLPEKQRAAVVLCNEESFARGRTVNAVLDALLGFQPQVGTVSWLVPICRALQSGGFPAASACCEQLQRHNPDNYLIDEDDLINLATQMQMAQKDDLAAAVLELNLIAFPHSLETLTRLSRLYQAADEIEKATRCLRRILAIDGQNETVLSALHHLES